MVLKRFNVAVVELQHLQHHVVEFRRLLVREDSLRFVILEELSYRVVLVSEDHVIDVLVVPFLPRIRERF